MQFLCDTSACGGKEPISQDVGFLPMDNFLDEILNAFMNDKVTN